MPKLSLEKNTVVILFNSQLGRDDVFHAFLRGISPKVNVIARLEFEFVIYVVAV